ncbi:unnamed protein product [Rhizophagus irregularis]|uniref:Uncharacterized protein n=1 Tax=Rhizophagus irregularis TaxID=588596 RepID=A0A915ZA72_9GLOM|nr:unnamed protein product [Rhizophagus irregularis]
MDFEQQIIEDIFIQTNGHAAFVSDFGHKVKSTDAEYLADEGVLVRGEVVGSFKLSSPLDVIFQARYHPFKLLNYQSILRANVSINIVTS